LPSAQPACMAHACMLSPDPWQHRRIESSSVKKHEAGGERVTVVVVSVVVAVSVVVVVLTPGTAVPPWPRFPLVAGSGPAPT